MQLFQHGTGVKEEQGMLVLLLHTNEGSQVTE